MTFSPVFATRLNSFKTRPARAEASWETPLTTEALIERAARVQGLTQVDLNYPDHLESSSPQQLKVVLADHGLQLNGLAMRYYSDPAYRSGAFTHPDAAVRARAIDLTKQGLDALQALDGDLMTLWLGQDGFDYAFQVDYSKLWAWELEGIRQVAEYAPHVRISIEYKPKEPRAYSLLPNVSTTLLAIQTLGLPNLGVTLDMAHVLYADEQPAAAAYLVARYSQLYGVHLNDAYGKRDDGLMVGSVHTLATLELLYALRKLGYSQAIYFDTFPNAIGLDPVAECANNIRIVQRMIQLLDGLDEATMQAILDEQDAIAGQRYIYGLLLGL
ncbi:MAG: sugar phosphate isomerase/epimerase [Anaerolineae bacterium]|nr:sugar phosphate isomerase/epimerase [Anaerolineae bacterium]MDW8172090.1 sugar phosphate isomerase/epimerase family protein [Anaerolineae bacterium]